MTTHSRQAVALDTDVYTLACERTEYLFDNFDHVFVAGSGGKDSTAVMNVALEVAHSHPRHARHLPLRVMHQDEEAIPMETEAYIRRLSQRDDINLEWLCIPLKHRNACARTSPWWWPWAPEAEDRWCRPMPPEAITTWPGFPINPPEARLTAPDMNGLLVPPELGNAVMLMGIRADESLIRRRALLRRRPGEVNYLIPYQGATSRGNLWKGYPIYDWSTKDVWTAPALKGWDYNRAYDRLEMAGVTHYQQRCSPAFGEEPLEKLHTYAKCFPEVWERMVDRVPGVGAAVRYARTELYGYRDRPDKPPGMPWPEFALHYLAKFRPVDAASIGARIKSEMRNHYRKSSTPIPITTRHPATGVSWEWLLMICMRGDFKSRKQAGSQTDNEPTALAKRWVVYLNELLQIIADGQYPELAHPGQMPDPYTMMPADVAATLTENGTPWPTTR